MLSLAIRHTQTITQARGPKDRTPLFYGRIPMTALV
jgi:hypothetical protein